jgi:hypothetical protein
MLQQLRTWLSNEEIDDPSLQLWVNRLSADEASILLDLLNGYFASLNWEMKWLFSPHLQKTPALQHAVEEGMLAYMRSILASLQLVEDVRAYNVFVELTGKPNGRRQSALIQKLYDVLVEQKIIKRGKKKSGLFAGRAMQKEQTAAVLQAFDREPIQAMNALKAILSAEAAADVQRITGVAAEPVAAGKPSAGKVSTQTGSAEALPTTALPSAVTA